MSDISEQSDISNDEIQNTVVISNENIDEQPNIIRDPDQKVVTPVRTFKQIKRDVKETIKQVKTPNRKEIIQKINLHRGTSIANSNINSHIETPIKLNVLPKNTTNQDIEYIHPIETVANTNQYSCETPIYNNPKELSENSINGWDTRAELTLKNWFLLLKQYKYMYQYILDRNTKISNRLSMISITTSTILGIFGAFQLWLNNDTIFSTTANVTSMTFNFLISIFSTLAKRYISDERNDKIRSYIGEIDKFIGVIGFQYIKPPNYRTDADKFFSENNDKYSSILSSKPNLSLKELEISLISYHNYINKKLIVEGKFFKDIEIV